MTNASGSRTAYHIYYPFGEEATSITQNTERMKFNGHERDLGVTTSAADDLDYMHARYYNPQVGRFLSTDPVNSATPGKPQSWNGYAYAVNNPSRFVDRNGLWAQDFHFDMTQLAAVIAGANRDLARSIALATNAVDTASATQPVTTDISVREDYHFATDARLAELLSAATADPMADLGEGRTPLGDYLHALQDSYSHQFANQRFENSHYPGPPGSFDSRAGFTLFGPDFDNTSIRPMVALSAFGATVGALSQVLGTTPKMGMGEYQSLPFDALKASRASAERRKTLEELYSRVPK